jgi:hypothetical protein
MRYALPSAVEEARGTLRVALQARVFPTPRSAARALRNTLFARAARPPAPAPPRHVRTLP